MFLTNAAIHAAVWLQVGAPTRSNTSVVAADPIECDETVADALDPVGDMAGGNMAALVDKYSGLILLILAGSIVFLAASKKVNGLLKMIGIVIGGTLAVMILAKDPDILNANIC